MIPSEIVTAARQGYNAVGDDFYSDAELYGFIDDASQQMVDEGLVIEATDTSITTVNGTRTYDFPDYWIGIKRVEWNGRPLIKIDFKKDDDLTSDAPNTTAVGDPLYYFEFNDQIYLRPVPSSAATLKLFGYKEPTPVTTASQVLEIPLKWHRSIVKYLTSYCALKDKNFQMSQMWMDLFQADLVKVRRWAQRRKTIGGFKRVKLEEIDG
jgi:hypothetical protein